MIKQTNHNWRSLGFKEVVHVLRDTLMNTSMIDLLAKLNTWVFVYT